MQHKFVYFGTPEFAVTVLNQLAYAGFVPILVVTAPDKPQGRKLVVTPPPVKVWAEQHAVPVLQPEKLDAAFLAQLKDSNADLFVVASYGKILKKEVLDMPKYGTLNVHPSLLPKYRGSSPIEAPILNGDTETGVSIMLLDEQMDHGPIIVQQSVPLTENSTGPELENKLATLGGELLAATIPGWIDGTIRSTEQDHSQATFTKKVKKEDGLIDLSDDPIQNYRKFRAYQDWPRTYFIHDNKRVVVTKAKLEDGIFTIENVIPEAKKEMPYEDFSRGK